MLNEPVITIQGNIASGPDLRYTPTGRPVISFSVAQNPRRRNSATGEWEDGPAVFMRVSAWGDLAENMAQSVSRGDPILVIGRVQQHEFTPRESGEGDSPPRPQRITEITADSVAVPMDRRILRLMRVTREPGSGEAHAAAQAEPAEPAEGSAQEPATAPDPDPAPTGQPEPSGQRAASGGPGRGKRKGAHAAS
jgi:single-strand DNA-binding protein